jgi:hypothetical protein
MRRPTLFVLAALATATMGGCSARNPTAAQSPETAFIVPKNELERALLFAATDPSRQTEFEARLLVTPVFVRVQPDAVNAINDAVGPDGLLARRVDMQVWVIKDETGALFLTAFTDLDRFNSIYPGAPWARMSGREVLKLAPSGAGVLLNPGLLPSVTLNGADVEMLLATR